MLTRLANDPDIRWSGPVIRPVNLAELPQFDGAFACNASAVQSIASIDETVFGASDAFMDRLAGAMAVTPWEVL